MILWPTSLIWSYLSGHYCRGLVHLDATLQTYVASISFVSKES